jgi:hypothetical protein
MADEFFSVMKGYSEAPLKERVEGLADVIEKIMIITLKIPEMMDQSIKFLSDSINGLDGRLKAMEGRIVQVESRVAAASGANLAVPAVASSPGAAPPPPPGSPPPPPGRAPPPKSGPPAGPVSLRGSIMDELKSLFSKRKAVSD